MIKGLIHYNKDLSMLFVQAHDTSFVLEIEHISLITGYEEGKLRYRNGFGLQELDFIDMLESGKLVSRWPNELRENLLKLEEKYIEFC